MKGWRARAIIGVMIANPEITARFPSIVEASLAGFDASGIKRCLAGQQSHSAGYMWFDAVVDGQRNEGFAVIGKASVGMKTKDAAKEFGVSERTIYRYRQLARSE